MPEIPFRIAIDADQGVSALLDGPPDPRLAYVFAHGAGAGMHHPSMALFAQGLAARGVATLRYQFPYMENGSRRPDAPRVAHRAVRAAVDCARTRLPNAVLFAGGRSFGGRMTSQAQAQAPLPGVRGLVFVGFPLHPAGKPAIERAAHLADVTLPMLFLQGSRDALAELSLLRGVAHGLSERATLEIVDDADHSFHVPARSGRKDADVRDAMLAATVAWMRGVAQTAD